MQQIVVNARFLNQPVTGVQRFALEICKVLKVRLQDKVQFVAPPSLVSNENAKLLGVMHIGRFNGQVWEQLELPWHLSNRYDQKPLLLNLGSTSPYYYENKVTTLHDIAFTVDPAWYSWKFRAWYKFLVPRLLRTSKKVITVSEFSKDQISQHYGVPESKIEVVYNAVSETFDKSNVYGAKPAVPYLLMVSSLSPRKNLKRALEAFKIVSATKPELKMIVVGEQRLRPFSKYDLKELLQIPNVELIGYISDQQVMDLYAHASAFIFTSLYEGFGIPPLEAAAMGCPSVVSKVTAMPEILGDSVCYCDPLNVEEIARGILKLLREESYRNDLVNKGYENLKRFDWERSADKVCQILEDVGDK